MRPGWSNRNINEKASQGRTSLSSLEKLIYCLWVADYGMRYAGDLATATDLYPNFLEEGHQGAEELGLPDSTKAFSMLPKQLEADYLMRFDSICKEIRTSRN
jgi:hypothetical protein